MPHIRLTAAAAAAVVLAFVLSPATARPCQGGDAGCVASAQATPMKLDNFMKTWKPVAKSKRAKKPRSARKSAVAHAKRKPAVKKIAPEAAVAKSAPPAAMERLAANPEQFRKTDAARITSFNEVNESGAAAGQVQLVAFTELNEIDLAAAVPIAPAESVGQSVAARQPAADDSWIVKLVLAVAGTIALAGATRYLVA